VTDVDTVAAWILDARRYTCRRACESAARKHGAARGVVWRAVLARRLVAVDVRPDGSTLARSTARALVDAWAKSGPRGETT
jgi:hypothetical protein